MDGEFRVGTSMKARFHRMTSCKLLFLIALKRPVFYVLHKSLQSLRTRSSVSREDRVRAVRAPSAEPRHSRVQGGRADSESRVSEIYRSGGG